MEDALSVRQRSRTAEALWFLAFVALAFVVYGRVFDMRPLGSDNLNVLSWADRTPAGTLLGAHAEYYPEWRPLPYLTIWLQYQWLGLDAYWLHHVVNVLLWAASAWLVWRLVVQLTGLAWAGLAAGWIMLADPRSVWTMTWIIERQSSMACIFGLIALFIVVRACERPLTNREAIGVAACLLASVLSKEFGLAFAGAVALDGLRPRGPSGRRSAAALVAAIAAGVIYFGLRVAIVRGAGMAPPCEEMGYFLTLRGVCYQPLNATAITQIVYNVVAAGVDTVMHGLLTGDGRISLAWSLLPASFAWCLLAVLGWVKNAKVRIGLFVVALNAGLNFTLYRDRNHLVGLCAVAIAAGVGLAVADGLGRTRPSLRAARLLAPLIVFGLLFGETVHTRRVVASIVDTSLRQDPCDELASIPRLDKAFVRRVKMAYGLSNPDCVASR